MLTGSVVASVTSAAPPRSGPTLRPVAGSAVTRPTTKPGAGSSSMSGTTGTVRTAEASNVSDSVAGVTCSTLTPVGTDDVAGQQVEQAPARTRAVQVEHRDQLGRRAAAPSAPLRAAQAHVDEARRLAEQLELIGDVADTRAARAAIAPPRAARPPVHHSSVASAIDSTLSAEIPEDPTPHLQAARLARRRPFAEPPRTEQLAQPRRADRSGVRLRSMRPSRTSEIHPVSSETTTASASFSSVRPIAARCRVPRSLLSRGFTVSGRKQAAAAMRFSWMITAPSCSGDAVLEDRHEQVVADLRVERNAALDVVAQADLALDGDDRAGALRRQHLRGDRDLLDRLVDRLALGEIAEERRAARGARARAGCRTGTARWPRTRRSRSCCGSASSRSRARPTCDR